ncbi:ABC-2 type transport system ATP-binding protein [Lacrimispora xylanisolvens]|uniref:ABC-2 type transport system ATP-binding protein n=1 Tax=Lacrimispora xylanisolvens TaxID=384636 RepID=A0A2S6HSS5_9FIRM|nr:ABC transporter ATP-binding protein [Hungatella xylanolytica]PPK80809.1 ABC-2 type transport system ATP-binding protein [Hungatella xylanolytica]
MDRFIQVIDVCKTLEGQEILKNINLEFDSSKIHGIIGRNGSGKTVLIKCICGFMPVSSGSIFVDEKRIGYDTEFIENTGFIIENPGFLNRYSGLKNLKYLASIRKIADVDRLRECMNMVGLDPDSKKTVGKYSLGMRQRLGIAQALMEYPDIIILDEPMNGLDNSGVMEIRKILLQLKAEGKLIIIISHNREDINSLCDKVYEMDKGEIKQVL